VRKIVVYELLSLASRGRRLRDGLPSIQRESIRGENSPTGYLLVDYRVIR
jgi:hypothetical protein